MTRILSAEPRVRHRSRDGDDARLPSLVTLKVRRGIGSLRNARVVREIEASFREACERDDFRLVHDSIQDDHAHPARLLDAFSPRAGSTGGAAT